MDKKERIKEILFDNIREIKRRKNEVIRFQQYNKWFIDEGFNHTEYCPVFDELSKEGYFSLENAIPLPMLRMQVDWYEL